MCKEIPFLLYRVGMQKEREFLSWLRLLLKICSISGGYLGPFSPEDFLHASRSLFAPLGLSCAKQGTCNSGAKKIRKEGRARMMCVMHIYDCGSSVVALFLFPSPSGPKIPVQI